LFFDIELMVESLGADIESWDDILSELWKELVKISLRVEWEEILE
jgi:hypothetical protein